MTVMLSTAFMMAIDLGNDDINDDDNDEGMRLYS